MPLQIADSHRPTTWTRSRPSPSFGLQRPGGYRLYWRLPPDLEPAALRDLGAQQLSDSPEQIRPQGRHRMVIGFGFFIVGRGARTGSVYWHLTAVAPGLAG